MLAHHFLVLAQVSTVLILCDDAGLYLFIEAVSSEFQRFLFTLVEVAVVWVLALSDQLSHKLDLALDH